MNGIYIKGMEMPKSCVDCRFHKSIYCTLNDICTNTAQGCPLIPVPPHGRLIDADDVYHVLTSYYHHRTYIQHEALREAITGVPTIIPADFAKDTNVPTKTADKEGE